MANGPSYLANFNSFTSMNHDFYLGPVNAQTGTTYMIAAADLGTLTTFSNSSAIAVTLPVASNTNPVTSYGSSHQFAKGWFAWFENKGTGTCTITPTTSTINDAATLALRTGDSALIVSDGTNYRALISRTLTDSVQSSNMVCTSTLSKTSDTTMADVPGLSINVTAGATYNFRAHLTGTSAALGGIKIQMSGTATATSITYTWWNWNGAIVNASATATALGSALGVTAMYSDIIIEGAIVVSAAGTLKVQAAQNASTGTATTVLINSNFTVNRVS